MFNNLRGRDASSSAKTFEGGLYLCSKLLGKRYAFGVSPLAYAVMACACHPRGGIEQRVAVRPFCVRIVQGSKSTFYGRINEARNNEFTANRRNFRETTQRCIKSNQENGAFVGKDSRAQIFPRLYPFARLKDQTGQQHPPPAIPKRPYPIIRTRPHKTATA